MLFKSSIGLSLFLYLHTLDSTCYSPSPAVDIPNQNVNNHESEVDTSLVRLTETAI